MAWRGCDATTLNPEYYFTDRMCDLSEVTLGGGSLTKDGGVGLPQISNISGAGVAYNIVLSIMDEYYEAFNTTCTTSERSNYTWKANTSYALNYILSTNSTNATFYKCIRAGLSGTLIPPFPVGIGNTVYDCKYALWTKNTNYVLGTRRNHQASYNNIYFLCTIAGISRNTDPSWNTTIGSLTTDGYRYEDYADWQPSTHYTFGDKIRATTNNGFMFEFYNNIRVPYISGETEPNWVLVEGAVFADGNIAWRARKLGATWLCSNDNCPIWESTSDVNNKYKYTFTYNTQFGETNSIIPANNTWSASTTYALGKTVTYSNNIYKCTIAGISGGTAPAWNTTIGATTVDNTVTWTCTNIYYQMVNVVSSNKVPRCKISGTITFPDAYVNIDNYTINGINIYRSSINGDDFKLIACSFSNVQYYEGGYYRYVDFIDYYDDISDDNRGTDLPIINTTGAYQYAIKVRPNIIPYYDQINPHAVCYKTAFASIMSDGEKVKLSINYNFAYTPESIDIYIYRNQNPDLFRFDVNRLVTISPASSSGTYEFTDDNTGWNSTAGIGSISGQEIIFGSDGYTYYDIFQLLRKIYDNSAGGYYLCYTGGLSPRYFGFDTYSGSAPTITNKDTCSGCKTFIPDEIFITPETVTEIIPQSRSYCFHDGLSSTATREISYVVTYFSTTGEHQLTEEKSISITDNYDALLIEVGLTGEQFPTNFIKGRIYRKDIGLFDEYKLLKEFTDANPRHLDYNSNFDDVINTYVTLYCPPPTFEPTSGTYATLTITPVLQNKGVNYPYGGSHSPTDMFTIYYYTTLVTHLGESTARGSFRNYTNYKNYTDVTYTRTLSTSPTTFVPPNTVPWAASTSYTTVNYVQPEGTNLYYKCSTAGTSGLEEPTWPTTIGQTYREDTFYTAWQGNNVYALNDIVVPPIKNGYFYKCTVAGTSGGTAPTWSTTIGGIVTDGEVRWTVYRSVIWTASYAVVTGINIYRNDVINGMRFVATISPRTEHFYDFYRYQDISPSPLPTVDTSGAFGNYPSASSTLVRWKTEPIFISHIGKQFKYKVLYTFTNNENNQSAESSPSIVINDNHIGFILNGDFSPSETSYISNVKIYRADTDSSNFYLLTTLANYNVTQYIDVTNDLGAIIPAVTTNHTYPYTYYFLYRNGNMSIVGLAASTTVNANTETIELKINLPINYSGDEMLVYRTNIYRQQYVYLDTISSTKQNITFIDTGIGLRDPITPFPPGNNWNSVGSTAAYLQQAINFLEALECGSKNTVTVMQPDFNDYKYANFYCVTCPCDDPTSFAFDITDAATIYVEMLGETIDISALNGNHVLEAVGNCQFTKVINDEFSLNFTFDTIYYFYGQLTATLTKDISGSTYTFMISFNSNVSIGMCRYNNYIFRASDGGGMMYFTFPDPNMIPYAIANFS